MGARKTKTRPAARKPAPAVPSGEQRCRAVIRNVEPAVYGGRFAVKRTVGETVRVEADVIADGHDSLACLLVHRHSSQKAWSSVLMTHLVNDRWTAEFKVSEPGEHLFAVRAWVDPFLTWRKDLDKRLEAGQDVSVDLLIGAQWVREASDRAVGVDAERLGSWADELSDESVPAAERARKVRDDFLTASAQRYSERPFAASQSDDYRVWADREKARFSTWYELFPRSFSSEPGRSGTFRGLEPMLDHVAGMGFDVLYLPPIHPVGVTHRKGKNNSTECSPGDPGSVWAIGSADGGHKSVNPELGSLDDFRWLVGRAKERGLEVALDIAFQCSPDHPYVREHPDWFRHRPDGSVQYAENPPKKYQDIYPLDFESKDWKGLWRELLSVFIFWAGQGVLIFRVDNPHTKPFRFWEWLIKEVRRRHPEAIFLAEAFTRPKVMYELAALGFTQSYTYFTWRNAKWELEQYFTELTQSPVREFFRPNLWPNTPDILHEYLRKGGRPAFAVRYVLAGTLGANCGVYGPAFELCADTPKGDGSEEYLDSEKYELKRWDLDDPKSLRGLIARINRARREHPALQSDHSLRFHAADNDQLLCCSKRAGEDLVLVVVNLDPHHKQSGWVSLPLTELGLPESGPYDLQDLLDDSRYTWKGSRNFVELRPESRPAHVFSLRAGGGS